MRVHNVLLLHVAYVVSVVIACLLAIYNACMMVHIKIKTVYMG